MVFIAVSTWIFMDFFLHDRITDIRLMLCGFSFASVALLRLNMTALWIVMCLAVLIKQAAAKDWIPLVRFLAFFLAGVGVLIVPVAIWLIRGGAFSAFWYDYITFNRIYASSPQIGAVFSQKCSTFMKFLTKPAFLAAVIASVLLIRRRSTFFNAVWITYMFVLLALTSMSGKPYAHYGMVLVPAVSYPYALLIGTAAASLPKDRAPEGGGEPSSTEGGHTGTMRSRIPVLVLCLLLLCSFVLPDWIHLAGTYPGVFAHRHEEHRSPVALAVANLVSQYTEEDEPISVHGNWDYIYVLSHRRHSTLYSFQQPIGAVMPEIMDEYIRQLDEEMPPMIIVQAGLPKKRIRRFLKKHPYRLVWSQNGDSDLSGALVYVREDRL